MARKERPQKNDDNDSGFPKKWAKFLPDGFMEEVAGFTEEDVKKTMLACNSNVYNIEAEVDADEKLNAAKEVLKDLSAGYKEALKTQNAKIKFCSFELKNRGKE